MPEEDPSRRANPLLMVFVVARVIIILAVWLGVFLAMFLGYFTVPVILIGAVAIIYAIADLGFYVAVNKQRKASDMRHTFLESITAPPSEQTQKK